MCVQINYLYDCGHRSFDQFENCPNFGTTCLGASGKHRDNPIKGDCATCTVRKSDQANGLWKNDPWGEDDPWKHQRNLNKK